MLLVEIFVPFLSDFIFIFVIVDGINTTRC